MHAEGLSKESEDDVTVGPLWRTFTDWVEAATRVGADGAFVASLAGQAWIYGLSQYPLDPTDPFREGYIVGGIWAGSARAGRLRITIVIPFDEGERHLDWLALTDALVAGHDLREADVADVFLYERDNTLLNRSAWIAGLGLAVKCATIFPGNAGRGKPTIGGAVNLFSGEDGTLEAIVDFHLVTKWKTAGDSLLGARRLARPDSRRILIVGAGTVG
ncbi:MAG: proline racemase family protein, partial [Pseudomonadota bacterium]